METLPEKIIQPSLLTPYFKVAESWAKTSPCTRRQYGALIAYDDSITYQAGTNSRVGKCCGDICARDRLNTRHGQRVEVGGEIHAETACLITNGKKKVGVNSYFLLVGFAGHKELYDRDVWPCHSCAMQIKYAGWNYIHIRDKEKNIYAISLAHIIEEREAEWETEVDV